MNLTSDNTYLLSGFVRVQSGATLTIQPGTTIYGENTSQGTLIIEPAGKLISDGDENNPIVFTSEFKKPGSTQKPNYGCRHIKNQNNPILFTVRINNNFIVYSFSGNKGNLYL